MFLAHRIAFARLALRLVVAAARVQYARTRPDPDGRIEWLEGAPSDSGYALFELESERYAFVTPSAY